jgi:hypothetical protein
LQGFSDGVYSDVWPFHPDSDFKIKDAGLTKVPSVTGFSWSLRFNLKSPAVNKIEVRKFVAKNLDVKGFLEEMDLPESMRAFGAIPRGLAGYRANPLIPDSPKDTLLPSHCTKKHPCKFGLQYFEDPKRNRAFAKLVAPLKKFEPNFVVALRPLNFKEFENNYTTHSYNILFMGLDCPGNDTYLFLRQLLNEKETPGLEKKTVKELLNQSLAVSQPDLRAEIFRKVDEFVVGKVAVLPIYHGDQPYRLVRSDIHGYYVPLMGFTNLRIMDLRRTDGIK